MAHVNRRFTSGLFGTQTAGWLTPFRGCPPVCTPVLWVKRAVGAVCVLVLTVGSVVVGSSSSLSMTERGAPAGAASVEAGTDTTVGLAIRLDSHLSEGKPSGSRRTVRGITPSVVAGFDSPAFTPDWTPTPQAGLSVVADGRHHSMTLQQYRAIQAFPEEQQMLFACIAYHESRWDTTQVGDHGRSKGAFQVQERFHGRVPDTLEEQAKHAAEVFRVNGSGIWTTAEACRDER